MGKKVLVLGVGAQGGAAARRLDVDPAVDSIICADYDMDAVNELVADLKKATGAKVDAFSIDSIVEVAQGVDLILNALALTFNPNVMEAALIVKADYQDYNGTDILYEEWDACELAKDYPIPDGLSVETQRWVKSYYYMYKVIGPKFEKIGKLALFGTGSAPGTICVATRETMKYLDSCDTIYNIVWEGVSPKRFQPFWWSPITAMLDMSDPAIAFENGRIIDTGAFSRPIKRQYDYMDKEIIFREHCHDEPLQYAFNAEECFKGCKNAYFKYAGDGMNFAAPLFEAGLLSHEEEEYNGMKIVPFDYIMSHVPPAPRFREEIKEIIDEGLISDSGCMVIESYGKKDGKDVLVESHVSAPGLVESFELAGITAEMYLTGQSGYLFSKMFLNDDFAGRSGLISTDMLSYEECDKFFEYAAELNITREVIVKEL
ncbi:MAG: saccharopine dehydrogenase NADP-binding domain-containing protein [Clostridia bacterium]|nr:saccharopine dehydrogenase NADP-binding domain-containing protein [Clostridia bacterium]